MSYNDRNEIFLTEEFIGKVRMALCDWLEYWASAGTASITDPVLRQKTDDFIRGSIFNLDSAVKRVSVLIISEPNVRDAVTITDQNVQTAMTNVLSTSLDYLM